MAVALEICHERTYEGECSMKLESCAFYSTKDLEIPILKLAFPTNQKELIELIDKTNDFLKDLDNSADVVNEDNLGTNLYVKKEKYPLNDFNALLDKLI